MLQEFICVRAWKSLDAKENFTLKLCKWETLAPCPGMNFTSCHYPQTTSEAPSVHTEGDTEEI
jgi:hypothetical protein